MNQASWEWTMRSLSTNLSWFLVVIMFFIVGCTKEANTPASDVGKGDDQRANEGSEVGPEAVFQGYKFRPPKGYSTPGVERRPFSTPDQKEVSYLKYQIWVGPERADRTKHGFRLTTSPLSPNRDTADLLLVEALDVKKGRFTKEWAQTPSETININGLTFLQCHWSRVWNGKKEKGFVMVAIDGLECIVFTSDDQEPHYETTLKVAEATAKTLRKR
jgi:hypothetical protein